MESISNNELKIELYPNQEPRGNLEMLPLKDLIEKEEKAIGYSFDKNKSLAFTNTNVPLLNGFYFAHINHRPIRIRPDDIWLLIVQAFSNHINYRAENLRKYFVNFDGKKEIEVVQYSPNSLSELSPKYFEEFSEKINIQMEKYLGKEIIDNLTPNFSTTDENTAIVCKISIMGSFKKYFEYISHKRGCGIPYLILEGTAEDFKKIKEKAEKLKKYEFDWYINRILPHIEKMIEAKEGKVDVDFFKNIVQKNTITIMKMQGSRMNKVEVDSIAGWIITFFAYLNSNSRYGNFIAQFTDEDLQVGDFPKLANQMLTVPFKLIEENTNNKNNNDNHGKEYLMKYKVGFIGCDQNEKNEIFPVQGWIVSPCTKEERESIL